MPLPSRNKKKTLSPYEHLVESLQLLLKTQDLWSEYCLEDIPKRWERHGDMILLPSSCFSDERWTECPNLWETVAKVLKCKKLARKHLIKADNFRTPQVELLFGEDGWTVCIENGIKYIYDVTKCMFSAGNITEKIRISKFDCKGETVIDMYAGIGYFTLPYLVHAKADVVHACEWNPCAVDALERGLVLNKVKDRCIIHFGDCREVCPVGIANRVNLGLLPSSEPAWRTACLALDKSKGGILHIHANVTSGIDPAAKNCVNSGNGKTNRSTSDQLTRTCTNESMATVDHCSTTVYKNDTELVTSNDKDVFTNARDQWQLWGNKTTEQIKDLIFEIYSQTWTVTLLHTEHVKTYAPHIDHLVADIKCEP